MRNLLTGTISSLALAMFLAGSASAAGMTSSSSPQTTGNIALQDQLERDASHSHSWLRQSPLGQVIVRGDAMQTSSRLDTGASAENIHPSRDN